MFRANRYFKGVLCVHNSFRTLDELLSLIPSQNIQKYDEDFNKNNEDKEGELEKIHHFLFLSKEQYFSIDAFSNEQLESNRENGYYKYNIYIIEMPDKFEGFFITAPYWSIISELSQLINERLIGRMLYCYASSEKVIDKIKESDLDGRLKLSGCSFQVGGDTKIRSIQLRGTNILETRDFSFIFNNPKKFVATEVRLRYTEGLSVKSSLRCDTKGRFRFHHPKKNENLKYVYKIIKFLIENRLLIKTEIKPFNLNTEEVSNESR